MYSLDGNGIRNMIYGATIFGGGGALAKAVKWRWISSKRITALRTMLMSWFR